MYLNCNQVFDWIHTHTHTMLRYASLAYSSVLAERRVYIMQGQHNFDWNKFDNGNVTYKHNQRMDILLFLSFRYYCCCSCGVGVCVVSNRYEMPF